MPAIPFHANKRSIFIFFTTFILFSPPVFAQNATIQGRVIDAATGEPLANTNITLPGTSLGAASDAAGKFVIENIPIDVYQVKASYIGYESSIRTVDLTKNRFPFLEFKLHDSFFLTEQVVVTATRTKKLMENVPVITEVITETEIKDLGAQNLAQALEDRPGISIEEGVAGGKSLRMGGVDGKYILVLIDGAPLAGKFNNRQQLDLINTSQVDHIEIVKGPGSALYGSEAMGGVINIVTRGFSDGFSLRAKAKAGSYDLYNGGVSLSSRYKALGYSLNMDFSRGGIDKNEVSINVTGTETGQIEGKLSYTGKNIGRLDGGVRYDSNEQNGEDPVFYTGTLAQRMDSYLNWHKEFSSKFEARVKGYGTNNERTYSETVRRSGHLARVDLTKESIIGLKTDATYHFCDYSRLNFGYDYSYDDFHSPRVLDGRNTRLQHGVFLQSESELLAKKLTFILGGRYDDISGIGSHTSPRVSVMYAFTPMFKVRASWGGGFRAPSFTDMYIDYYNTFIGYSVVGNPDLEPEKSTGGSLGLEYFWNYSVLTNITLYHNSFRDMILDYSKAPGVLSYKNVDSAEFSNIELQSKFYLMKNLTATLSYNYTNAKNSSDIDALLNISPHQAALKLNWKAGKYFRLSLRDNWYSERNVREFDRRIGRYLDDKLITQSAYHLLDATLTWKLSRHLFADAKVQNSMWNDLFRLRFGVTNLADYTDSLYGPWIGRRFFISLDIDY